MQSVKGGVGKRRSVCVNCSAADQEFGKVKLVMEFVGGFAKHGDRGPSDFRPDPVSWQQNNGLLHFENPGNEKLVDRAYAPKKVRRIRQTVCFRNQTFRKLRLRAMLLPRRRLLCDESPHARWRPNLAADHPFADRRERSPCDRPPRALHRSARSPDRPSSGAKRYARNAFPIQGTARGLPPFAEK